MPELRRVTDSDIAARVRAAAGAASAGVRKRVTDPAILDRVRRAAGITPSERIDEAFSVADTVADQLTSRATAFGRGAAQGATAGFHDELRGLGEAGGVGPDEPLSLGGVVRGGYRMFTGTAGAGDAYQTAVEREHQRLDIARRERPVSAFGGELAGAVATAPALPLRVPQGAGWTARALQSAKAGGAYGSVYGFGVGEGSFANRLREAVFGGAFGAVAGGVSSPFIDLAIAGARRFHGGLRNLAQPFTRRGQEVAAGEALRRSATDIEAAQRRLSAPEGFQPTTAQATGDPGLVQLERRTRVRRPDGFVSRAEEQDTARRAALTAIQSEGYPQTVSAGLRVQLDELDRLTSETISDFEAAARTQAERLGGDLNAEQYGDALRAFAASAREAANRQRRALYDAVDPTGRLAMPGKSIADAAREISAKVTPSARPMAGEEAAIFNAARCRSYEGCSSEAGLRGWGCDSNQP